MFSIFKKLIKHDLPEQQILVDNSEPISKAELENIKPYSYNMSPLEYWRYRQFVDKHYNQHKADGVIHITGFPVTFQPTGIGNNVIVRCPICGVACDITDVDCW